MSAQRPEAPLAGPVSVTDFGHYAGLRAAAQRNDPRALRQAAQQFEAMLTETLLKTSRQAKLGDDLTGAQGDFYNDLFDQQMALHLSAGKGLGLADMLVRQLSGLQPHGAAKQGAQAAPEPHPSLQLKPATSLHQPAATVSVPVVSSAKAPIADSAQAFVDAVRPHAEKAAAALGVPAQALIAQAALETGWGRHVGKHADGGYNLFGVKAHGHWSGASHSQSTSEYENGRWTSQTASFRSYDSIGAAFDDYVSFLQSNPRYAAALRSGDVHGFAHGLQRAGYATDPHYAQKLISVASRVRLDGPRATPRTLSA